MGLIVVQGLVAVPRGVHLAQTTARGPISGCRARAGIPRKASISWVYSIEYPGFLNYPGYAVQVLKDPLFHPHELAYRTQYAELKERVRATAALLPGSPGTLVLRSGTGRSYWYRAYQGANGNQVEDLVGRDTDEDAYAQAASDLAFAKWVGTQVRTLRKLEFQTADKAVANVLVQLHNAQLLGSSLCVVGTLGYMAWLNELGARAVVARTEDIDLAARQGLKLAAPRSFFEVVEGTKMGFNPVPGLPSQLPSASVKLPGAAGLRVNVLTHGEKTGKTVALAPLQWHAQTVAHYDYLLQDTREAAILAGGHCIPVRLPAPERFIWHKLYASAVRKSFPEKAAKDFRQAVTLAAILTEQDEDALSDSAVELPRAVKSVLVRHRAALRSALERSPATRRALDRALDSD
ncbi:MAG: GSU2403 family nucleotidyltransferase fold protein [Pseudomonadota bacterium]